MQEERDITALAERAARDEDPEEALRALTHLREELARLEAEHVRRALGRGATWSRIAEALGVSKQAAHKRHRNSRDAAPEKVRISHDARRAIAHGRAEAIAANAPRIGSDHLLLGVLAMGGSRASRALEGLGADTQTLRGVIPKGENDPGPHLSLAPEARKALERSLQAAASQGRQGIDTEQLVLALIEDPRGPAAFALEAAGVGPQAVRSLLA